MRQKIIIAISSSLITVIIIVGILFAYLYKRENLTNSYAEQANNNHTNSLAIEIELAEQKKKITDILSKTINEPNQPKRSASSHVDVDYSRNMKAIYSGNLQDVVTPTFEPLPPRPSILKANTDILALEFPAFKDHILQSITDGYNTHEIRTYLNNQEAIALYVDGLSQEDIDARLGRTPESKAALYKANEENAYYKLMGDSMTPRQIKDLINIAEKVGASPSMLYEYPEIYRLAQIYASKGIKF